MKTISIKQPINLKVVRFELDFSTLAECPKPKKERVNIIKIPKTNTVRRSSVIPSPPAIKNCSQKRNVKDLIEELLDEIYADQRDWSGHSVVNYSHGSTSAASLTSSQSNYGEQTEAIERNCLEVLDIDELREQRLDWENKLQTVGERLAKSVRARDRLRRQQKRLCTAFNVLLRHIYNDVSNIQSSLRAIQMSALLNSLRNLASTARATAAGENNVRFGLTPSSLGNEGPGEGGYAEWLHAMRLVARLPAGVPHHFRRKLWLTLAERHLTARGIDWMMAERACFRGTAQPDDTELGSQILKDLHRTGCSLFCGTEGRENQAMLRRVLLAYARWNKEVGYCQGFNMLAAIILEVMDKSESDSLKVMIYLVEAVLPEGYFADDLRGLSADMAAFRDLLRLRLPRLAHHMDHLQKISDGGGIEPPLPDVFTMQWFLTLYATWLPRESLLRIWDLILLDGNEVLLLTALAIWDMLQDRILSARSADEFYSCMGGGAGAVWEAGEALVARVVAFGSAPELPRLRSIHRYKVTPPAPPSATSVYQPPLHSAMSSMTKRGLRLFYSEDEGDSSDDGNKMALATVTPRREDRLAAGDRLSLDIGALKRQYARLRERQRQAHVILAAACARHAAVGVPTSPTSLTVNNLLLGKSAIVSSRGRRLGPPPGAIPPSRQTTTIQDKFSGRPRARSNDTISWNDEKNRKSLSRRNSVKWKDIKKEKDKKRKASIDLDEIGDGVIVSEIEANQMIATLRSRSSSETSTYSSHSASSTDTSLCDENERASDTEPDLPDDDGEKINLDSKNNKFTSSPVLRETKISHSSIIPESLIPYSSDSNKNINYLKEPMKSITDYLDSAAGEPLRTYIDGFESKLKDNIFESETENYKSNHLPSYFTQTIAGKEQVLQRLNKSVYDDNAKISESVKPSKFKLAPKKFTDLSPIDLSPCHCGNVDHRSMYNYNYEPNFRRPCASDHASTSSRPLDIIDSFTKYPNFIPDIDLSDKNISDIDSAPGSPSAESIIVSEDEPPIPLKIDKYFEHSPEFFGARLTDPNSAEIPNRRPTKRISRQSKKPDSLNLHSSNSDRLLKEDLERASSLPQNHHFMKQSQNNAPVKTPKTPKPLTPEVSQTCSPKDYFLHTGRKNSERALQIIQENSKILSRILTKQNVSKKTDQLANHKKNAHCGLIPEKPMENKLIHSPSLKESTSDSIIGYRKRNLGKQSSENADIVRIRPISIDDPFSLESRGAIVRTEEFNIKDMKSPSFDCIGNKTDVYGWENKGFFVKCDPKKKFDKSEKFDFDHRRNSDMSTHINLLHKDLKAKTSSELLCLSGSRESKPSVALPSPEIKDTSIYERHHTTEDYNYPFSSKYSDFIIMKDNNLSSKLVDLDPNNSNNLSKTDCSQVSEFAHIVTSSISFTYEPSVEDDSPTGVKSNSSDTLCQITSLDQISTPISPKTFPRDTPTLPKDYNEKSDKSVLDSEDTCSAITSLIETDTLSSFSYPRSPSTGSYHPFPSRPAIRMPKELGVRLGMYPKDAINSPSK